MKAVIMAGGKGTRLHDLTGDTIPKPLVSVAGKPILEWQLDCLRRNGIVDICVIVGHLGEKIQNYFGDGGKFGVSICYYMENSPMGTAGALAHIREFLTEPYYLLVFGDTVFDIDIKKMEEFHKRKKSFATLFAHPNSHPYDSDLLLLDSDERVSGFDSKKNTRTYWYDNIVNAGLYILPCEITELIPQERKTDLEKDVLFANYEKHRMYGYRSPEYIKDVGTIDRIQQAEIDILSGVVAAKNISKRQRCIFLDRDGTINKYRGLIYNHNEFKLEDTAAEAIRMINKSSFLAVVASNQPVVARGLCGVEDVELIHRKMKTLLGGEGAYLDLVEYCPHHPDKGYPDENPQYKIPCDCRKPGTGMITKAALQMNIDVSRSWMIGDTTRDIQTAKNVGMRSILVQTGESGLDGQYIVESDVVCNNILEAVQYILKVGD